MRFLICFLLAIGLLTTGCGDSATGPSDEPVWLPLNESTQWTYDVSGFVVEEGDTVDVSGQFQIIFKNEIMHSLGFPVIEIEEIDTTNRMPRMGGASTTESSSLTFYRRETDDMIRYYYDLQADSGYVELMLPLEVGDTWECDFPDVYDMEREVISLTDSVSVPFGSFGGCAHVRHYTGSSATWDFWFADGQGIVRWTVEGTDSNLLVERVQ